LTGVLGYLSSVDMLALLLLSSPLVRSSSTASPRKSAAAKKLSAYFD